MPTGGNEWMEGIKICKNLGFWLQMVPNNEVFGYSVQKYDFWTNVLFGTRQLLTLLSSNSSTISRFSLSMAIKRADRPNGSQQLMLRSPEAHWGLANILKSKRIVQIINSNTIFIRFCQYRYNIQSWT